jgi:hypothetical protein
VASVNMMPFGFDAAKPPITNDGTNKKDSRANLPKDSLSIRYNDGERDDNSERRVTVEKGAEIRFENIRRSYRAQPLFVLAIGSEPPAEKAFADYVAKPKNQPARQPESWEVKPGERPGADLSPVMQEEARTKINNATTAFDQLLASKVSQKELFDSQPAFKQGIEKSREELKQVFDGRGVDKKRLEQFYTGLDALIQKAGELDDKGNGRAGMVKKQLGDIKAELKQSIPLAAAARPDAMRDAMAAAVDAARPAAQLANNATQADSPVMLSIPAIAGLATPRSV